MEKEFIPYDLSLKLKALGFDKPCFGYFNVTKHLGIGSFIFKECDKLTIDGYGNRVLLRPTFSQAFRWFRKTYILQHSIDPTSDQQNGELGYNYWIWNYKTGEEYHSQNKNRPVGDWEYKHHEEVEFDCLKRLIEIVESKSKNK